LYATQLIIIIN